MNHHQQDEQLRPLRLLLDTADQRQAGGAKRLVNMQDGGSWTCLHRAVWHDSLEVAELLLDAAQRLMQPMRMA